jgi:AcrR family transcriptional regulator
MASNVTTNVGSARERLLAAANELFYLEGIHTVGIDRVIERAGVAKASLYSTFGSKDELVRAYLEGRARSRQERVSKRIASHDNPRDQILAIFDLLGETVAQPTFRGCAFINASAEGPRDESKTQQVCVRSRAWMRGVFVGLARDYGAGDGERLGRQLSLVYDGAMDSAAVDRDPGIAREARLAAETLLAAHGPAPKRAPSRRAPRPPLKGAAGQL